MTNPNPAGKDGSRSDVGILGDLALVLDDRTGIDDGVITNARVGLDDGSDGRDRAGAEGDRWVTVGWGKPGKGGGGEGVDRSATGGEIAQGDEDRGWRARGALERTDVGEPIQADGDAGRIVVVDADDANARASGEVGDDEGVSPAADEGDFGWFGHSVLDLKYRRSRGVLYSWAWTRSGSRMFGT